MMKLSEEHIARLLQQQDRTAVEALYDRYAPTLYGIILKIVPDEAIAQDVLQETLIKAWKHGHQYCEEKGTLFTWLLNIARNQAIDKTRSAAYRRRNSVSELAPELSNTRQLSEEYRPEHIGIKQQVEALEEKYRQIIALIYFQGFTQSKVKDHLQIPLGTVKSRLRIGLKKLRKVFGNQTPTIILGVLSTILKTIS